MWIKYIELKNFQNIKTGLNAKSLSIDFSNRENVICLFVGPNGIGKTSLLSCLTPFATLGNLDIRDSNQLVVNGESGYKKIIICDKGDTFVIQHYYTPSKNTHTVKSYIALNGNELNPNGNVTSFKNIVSDYLSIDMDYLKLIRLGDNVTNLINLKSTDRKNFMSKFLDSVDIYLKYHQKITSDVRDLKLILSHTTDKINKLGIEDKDEEETKIDEIKQAIVFKETERDTIQNNKSVVSYKLSSLEIPIDADSKKHELEKKINKFKKALDNPLYSKKDSSEIEKLLSKNDKNLALLKGKQDSLREKIKNGIDDLNVLREDIDELEREIKVEIEKSNLYSLKDYLEKLHQKREILEKTLPVVSFKDLTKEEVDEFVVKLKNCQKTLNITYEFGSEPIKDAIKVISSNGNIQEFISSKLVAIEKKKKHNEKTYLDKIIDKYSKVKRPNCGDCMLVQMFDDIMMIKDIEPETSNKLKSPEYYEMVNAVHSNISFVITELKSIEEIMKKVPEEIQKEFLMETFFSHLKKCELIYNEKNLNNFMTEFTEVDNYNNLLNEISKTQEQIRDIETKSSIPYLSDMLDKKKKDYDKKNREYEASITGLEEMNDEVTSLEAVIEELDDAYHAREEMETLETSYSELVNKMEAEKIYKKETIDISIELSKTEKELADLNDYLKKKEINLETWVSLNKELQKVTTMYDELLLVKSSTSNKDGIPLVYIKFYLKNIKELANTLLDIVYDGKLYIEDFYITADDFKIPFVKNGVEISDIAFASQGERSFLSMAISFALSSENLKKYNIPLLDEVDSTFDSSNRERFLSIIEHQNDIIQCEQEFVISHNNMFSQYPVDVLDFSNLKNSKFEVKLS